MDDVSKAKITTKVNERRQPHQQIEARTTNLTPLKNDNSHVIPSKNNAAKSPVKKMLIEADKIVKIGVAKEFDLFEKENAIQNSTETIENLRRNILQLQMEYEKLDQNYQTEISCRSEVIKRIDTTRTIVESTVQHSNILSKSVKQLDEDKLRIAEFYELIYNRQKEIEEKYKTMEKFVKELEDLLNAKFDEICKKQRSIALQNSEALTDLQKKLSYANENLQIASNENKNLLNNIEELNKTIQNLSASLEGKQQIISSQQQCINKIKITMKSVKIKSSKYKKMWIKKKKEICTLNHRNNHLVKSLLNVEASYQELLSNNQNLELEKNELKSEIKKQLELFQIEKQENKMKREELSAHATARERENKELTINNEELKQKISELELKTLELKKKDENEKLNLNHLQENYIHVLHENKELKGSNNELSQENIRKTQLILDFESKLNIYDNDLNTKATLYKNELEQYETLVKSLKIQLGDLQENLSLEKAINEKIVAENNDKLKENKNLNEKISRLEKDSQEMVYTIESLNSEKKEKITTIQSLYIEIEGLKNTKSRDLETISSLKVDIKNFQEKNNELIEALKSEKKLKESLQNELENYKTKLTDLDKKLAAECSLNEVLKAEKIQLEKSTENLKNKIEIERKSTADVKSTNLNLEEKVNELEKVLDENIDLRKSVTDLKSRLEEADVRIEAFKVIIKKLEAEKSELKNIHSQEISKLKFEMSILQETRKKDKDTSVIPNTSQHSQHSINEHSEGNPADLVKLQQCSTTPGHSNKKFLSTPRKVTASASRSRLKSVTPIRKKRDPYDFDSDGSVERFDPDQVLKVFNVQTKKESAKRSKTKNIF